MDDKVLYLSVDYDGTVLCLEELRHRFAIELAMVHMMLPLSDDEIVDKVPTTEFRRWFGFDWRHTQPS